MLPLSPDITAMTWVVYQTLLLRPCRNRKGWTGHRAPAARHHCLHNPSSVRSLGQGAPAWPCVPAVRSWPTSQASQSAFTSALPPSRLQESCAFLLLDSSLSPQPQTSRQPARDWRRRSGHKGLSRPALSRGLKFQWRPQYHRALGSSSPTCLIGGGGTASVLALRCPEPAPRDQRICLYLSFPLAACITGKREATQVRT